MQAVLSCMADPASAHSTCLGPRVCDQVRRVLANGLPDECALAHSSTFLRKMGMLMTHVYLHMKRVVKEALQKPPHKQQDLVDPQSSLPLMLVLALARALPCQLPVALHAADQL